MGWLISLVISFGYSLHHIFQGWCFQLGQQFEKASYFVGGEYKISAAGIQFYMAAISDG